MITFNDALEIAKKHNPNITGCDEWTGGWVFGDKNEQDNQGGYEHAPIIITKDTGEMMSMIQFVTSGKAGEYIRSFDT